MNAVVRVKAILAEFQTRTGFVIQYRMRHQEHLISGEARGLFSLRVEHNFLKPVSYRAKGYNHDNLVINVLFCQGMQYEISTSYTSLS